MNTATQTNETPKRPVAKLRVGLVHAYIWPRETDSGVFHNVSFERRYRDADGKWQSTFSYGFDDLLALSKLADMAHSQIIKLQEAVAT